MHPAIQRIGVVSFSVYLWHFGVIMLFARFGIPIRSWHGADYLVDYVAVLTVAYLVAEASYRMVERPMIHVGNGVAARWRARQAARII